MEARKISKLVLKASLFSLNGADQINIGIPVSAIFFQSRGDSLGVLTWYDVGVGDRKEGFNRGGDSLGLSLLHI